MTNIVILSDTHGLLREQVKAELSAADCIMHAGDFNTPKIVESLQSFGKTFIVRGNNDKEWAEDIPQSLQVTIDGVTFYMVHRKKDVPEHLTNADVIIFGHSHQYSAEVIDGILWLNPGSCGKRRFDLQLTMCRMTVDNGQYRYEKLVIPHQI